MPDRSKSDLYAAIRRETRAGVVADRDAHRDYMTEGLERGPRPARTHRPVAEEDLMLPVIYSMSVSLDGFIAAPDGDIGWTAPDAEQFRFHIEQTRHIAAHLCGYAACTRKRWCGRPPSRPCPARRSWSSPDLATDPEGGVLPDAEFGGRQRAAGHRRPRHRGRPAARPAGRGRGVHRRGGPRRSRHRRGPDRRDTASSSTRSSLAATPRTSLRSPNPSTCG